MCVFRSALFFSFFFPLVSFPSSPLRPTLGLLLSLTLQMWVGDVLVPNESGVDWRGGCKIVQSTSSPKSIVRRRVFHFPCRWSLDVVVLAVDGVDAG
ncbi:hypothetical protein PISMIDRAFT_682147 [Pisolithus microcarpus 441]|uniref:Secreted protein n=1 Tax=Pisolithus microcarpus 441 TaxID=765257 RepID=A0A0C9ZLJ3_9AGAM|nr:hypothetical protein PISMIDRAFT_682147 [Pisolithus microcarpus 441]